MRVADYIALRCVEAGARHAFLVTGGGAMHLNDAFARNKQLKVVCFHHEQGAAIAAESYFRLTNRLAVLNVTTGPGGINALNGVYGAYTDSLGMLVVSGQVKRETYLGNYPQPLRQLGDQEVDIVSMVRPIVKYATVLQDPLKVREVMDKAVYLATSGRPGPVWIDVPVDVQSIQIDPAQLGGYTPVQTTSGAHTGTEAEPANGCSDDLRAALLADPDVSANAKSELSKLIGADASARTTAAIAQIIAKLKQAQRPVLFVGGGIRISGMHAEFLTLADTLGIPVVTGWNAHDTLTNDHPCYTGRPGTVGDRPGNFTVQNADFLLVLGSRLNIRQVSYNWKSFGKHAWKAMVDADQAELDKPTLTIDCPVHATLQQFIPQLQTALKGWQTPAAHQDYLAWCRERLITYPVVLPEYRHSDAAANVINPYCFIETLFSQLNKDDIVVAGNGSACVISFQAATLRAGQRLYTNSGSASMGYDLPAAIGACIAAGGKRVICLAGDGSLMMNLQELQTMVGYALPIKVIVLNNDGYHSIRQTQEAYFSDNIFGIGPSTGVSIPDFVALGNALTIHSQRVSAPAQTSAAIAATLDHAGPALLEVMLDIKQGFSPKLSSRKLPDGSMVSPSLEDMAPFLPREEMARNMKAEQS